MFKIGDKVRFKSDVKVGIRYSTGTAIVTLQDTMFHLMNGKVVTVDGVYCGGLIITVKENGYSWNEAMFERVYEAIVIETHGMTVVAKGICDGRVVKSGVAKCCPEDTFDAYEGTRIAIDRLFDRIPQYKKPEVKTKPAAKISDHTSCSCPDCTCAPVMATRTKPETPRFPYAVGDKVRIVNEFTRECAVNAFGKMDKWLGKVMTIKEINPDGSYCLMEEDADENCGTGWGWNKYCIAGKVRSMRVASESTSAQKKMDTEELKELANLFDELLGTLFSSAVAPCTETASGTKRTPKVGDRIKIVRTDHIEGYPNTYRVGDIGRVERMHELFTGDVYAFGGQWIEKNEFVILDN